jgi:transposase
LGIGENLIYRWKKEQKSSFELNTTVEPEQIKKVMEENEVLKKQLRRIEMERDVLKKVISIFSHNE